MTMGLPSRALARRRRALRLCSSLALLALCGLPLLARARAADAQPSSPSAPSGSAATLWDDSASLQTRHSWRRTAWSLLSRVFRWQETPHLAQLVQDTEQAAHASLAQPVSEGAEVVVGGEHGWVVITYWPMEVAVGSVLNFTYDEAEAEAVGGHDVWLMPGRDAWERCDFSGAKLLGGNRVLFNIAEPGEYFFACRAMDGAHCTAGHRVEVTATRGRSLKALKPRGPKVSSVDAMRAYIAKSKAQYEARKQSRATGLVDMVSAVLRGATVQQQATNIAWCALKGKDWSSATTYAAFDMFGCTQVSGIHVQLMYDKSVVVIDRTDTVNTVLKYTVGSLQQNAYGEELQINNIDPVYPFAEKPLDVVTNLFCSTGQVLGDGRMVSIGGSTEANTNTQLLNGSFSVRAYKSPCNLTYCSFSLEEDMTSRRWYPTAQIMPDGRVLIVGGSNTTGNVAINKPGVNNPTVEYHPRRTGEGNYYLQFLDDTMPYNLYAFVHLLPSGRVFIFAANQYILFSSTTNQEIPGNYPGLEVIEPLYNAPIMRSYPISGTSSLFPLDPASGYQAEIMVCGGSSTKATPINGGSQKSSIANRVWFADYMCYRIKPEAATPAWVPEPMCDTPACGTQYRRVMGDAVLLADGSLLILNGAQQGFQGLTTPGGPYDGGFAINPQFQPLLYFTNNYTWYNVTKLPASRVPRMYHSSALLMQDASVLVTGSNPNTQNNWPNGKFPTEFRLERFRPPYLNTGLARPTITQSPKAITVNTLFAVFFTATQSSAVSNLKTRFKFTLAYPGFSTHNQRHGMRNINMVISSIMRIQGSSYIAVVKAPPSLNHAPPTMYWLYLLDNGIPNVEAKPINVTRSFRSIAATVRMNGNVIMG